MRKLATMKKGIWQRFTFLLALVVLTSLQLPGQSFVQRKKAIPADREPNDRFGNAVAMWGRYALVGAYREDDDAFGSQEKLEAGTAYMMRRDTNGVWNVVQKLVASDRDTSAEFGTTLDLEGDYAIIGAPEEDFDAAGQNYLASAGAVYAFHREPNGTWIQTQKIVSPFRMAQGKFGLALSLKGDMMAIGMPGDNLDQNQLNPLATAGSVRLFQRNPSGQWMPLQKVVPNDRITNHAFGTYAIAVDSGRVLVGVPNEPRDTLGQNSHSGAGAGYIFEPNINGIWIQRVKLVASDRALTDNLGWSVALLGDTAILGAPNHDYDANGMNQNFNTGAAYVYKLNGLGQWPQIQKFCALHRRPWTRFGYCSSVSGNRIAFGTSGHDSDLNNQNPINNAGAAWIFKRGTNGLYAFEQKILASDRELEEAFGNDIAIYGRMLLVGNDREDEDQNGFNSYFDAGAVYYYELPCSLAASASICQGDTLVLGGVNCTTQGTYPSLVVADSCNVVIMTYLSVTPTQFSQQTTSICQGDSALLFGIWRHTPGTYTDTLTTLAGCDSVATINLIVSSHHNIFQTVSICQGDSLQVGSQQYTVSGTYTDSLQSFSGCDSIVTSQLSVLPTFASQAAASICQGDSILLGGSYQNGPGLYQDVYTAQNGCDSIRTTTLAVLPTHHFPQTITICRGDSALVYGNYISTAGTYTLSLMNIHGCDSINQTILNVEQIDTGLTATGNTLLTQQIGLTYQWVDCQQNFVPIPGQTGSTFTPSASGVYAAIITTALCMDTTICLPVTLISTVSSPSRAVSGAPTPTSGIFKIDLGAREENIQISVYDCTGRNVSAVKLQDVETCSVDATLWPSGIYFVRINSPQYTKTLQLIKIHE